ncbi:VIT and vWA domain-containing protein [Oceanobacter mangrovi]|uniref:VIT and vWA domain-containing protein n=1 Tax=Oceanobacter mangrovi TaxID=2862510 RepID=UPI001C8E37AD|nr:VIT domain-containing protein [Oceanobacter mangrovi]
MKLPRIAQSFRTFHNQRLWLATASLASALLLASGQSEAAGLLTPKNASYQPLTIESQHVKVVIADGYATTQVEQVFRNPNASELEAMYSFPVPDKAAVGEFTYWINGQPVTGEVLEKQQAREVYEEQKAAGNETALVEQDSYKDFNIAVYPVPASDTVKIRLVYIQPTHTDNGVGRYVYPLEEGGVDIAKDNFWNRNDKVQQSFRFDLTLRSSYPIDGLRLPDQPGAVVNRISEQEYQVSLSNQTSLSNQASAGQAINAQAEGEFDGKLEGDVPASASANAPVFALDHDIVTYWRHTPGLPGRLDMVSYKPTPDSKGTFMMTLTPAMDLAPIQQGRDWVFVLDVSGSMQGKFSTLVEGVRKAMGKLSAQDRVRVILFNSTSTDLSQGYVAVKPENVNQLLALLDAVQPQNGTNLYAGLKDALQHLDADRPAGIVLVTDGVANVGTTEKRAFLELLQRTDVRLFSFIMGNQANRPLLQGMSKVSQGFYQEVSNADDLVGQIMLATAKLTHQALRDVQVEIDGVRIKDLQPQTIGSLYQGQQLQLFGHYWQGGSADVKIRGRIGAEQKLYQTRIEFPQQDNAYPELERLWAYAAIEGLQDQQDYLGANADTKQSIVDIAKEYGLVTDYTSMIVLREDVFQAKGIQQTNKQRVATEQQAREQRAAQPVQDHRVDQQQPLYTAPAPSVGGGSGGGGALGAWILALLGLGGVFARRRQQ